MGIVSSSLPNSIYQLVCFENQMNGSDVLFVCFPIEIFTSARIYYPQLKTEIQILDADFHILRDYIDRFQRGIWPDPNLSTDATPSPADTDTEFACED